MKKQLLTLLGFAILQGSIHYGIFTWLGWEFNAVILFLYLYMMVLSFVFERVLLNEKNPKKFVNYYMAFSGGKLMLSLFILLSYALFNRDYLVPFAVSFLIVYGSFTVVEIIRLMRHLKTS